MTDMAKLHKKLLEILDYVDSVCQENGIVYSLCAGSLLGAVRHKGFIPWDDDLDIMLDRRNYSHLIAVLKEKAINKFVLQEALIDYPLYFSKIRMNGTTYIEGFKLQKKWRNIHQGIYIDVFCYDYASKNRLKLFFQSVFGKVLIAQSLFQRGFDTASFVKKIIMLCSMIFYPLRKLLYQFVIGVDRKNSCGVFNFFGMGFGSRMFFEADTFESVEYVQFEDKIVPISSKAISYLERKFGDWKTLPSEKQRQSRLHCNFFSDTKDYTEFLNNYGGAE